MVKTKKETTAILENFAERNGMSGISEAAMHVIENYQDYDYNGSDRLFIAFCEEIVDKLVTDPEEFEKVSNSIIDDNKSS